MDLPDTSTINFFNKVLISLEALCPDGDFCSVTTLVNQCRSIVTGARRADYHIVLEQCREAGLVQVKGARARISSLGVKFLSANNERYFEITEAQKQLVAERIVFKGRWNHKSRELFDYFLLDQKSEQYEFSKIDESLPTSLIEMVQLFKHLGILDESEFVIIVKRAYSQLVYELTADSKALAELELERILAENRKLGAKAENAVVEFEKRRLRKLGRNIQAELVKRISTVNVGAGYDVESFDGVSDEVFPNRFIEVKATRGYQLRFYWTRNEKDVASKKKKQYWIYAMVEFKEDKPNECLPIVIQDPNRKIPKHSSLSMEAHTFLITEIGNIEVEEKALDEVKWYSLT